jgi:c-di-GMP-binding flagellar brake protein YcgR
VKVVAHLAEAEQSNVTKSERRRAPRANVNLPARWEGVISQQHASVTNLSVNGCFVLSGGSVEPKELLRLEITFPDNDQIYPWAEVVEEAGEIGFAVRFTSMDDNEQERLQRFLTRALEKPGVT